MFPRPDTLDLILPLLTRLALDGPLRIDEPAAHWMEAVGIGDWVGDSLVARADWLASAFPARGERDLLRRVAFLDPAYRLHLDILLGRVLVSMARDQRMAKVEEYLTGQLSPIAPRLAYLLGQPEFAGEWPDSSALDLRLLGRGLAKVFLEWDRALFGDVLGGPNQRFPVIADIYGPLAGMPVQVRADELEMTLEERELAADLIHAGWDRQGVYLAETEARVLHQLVERTCLPLRMWSQTNEGSILAACIGPVLLLVKSGTPTAPERRSRCPVPGELPRELVQGRVVPTLEPLSAGDLWGIVDESRESRNTPLFPGSTIFDRDGTTKPVFDLRDAGYLSRLAGHPFYGLLLQFLVIEAFGRELGDESITILPVGSPDHPERIDVYYRPLGTDAPPSPLGTLDDVFDAMIRRWGLCTLKKLWEQSPYRTWSQSLLALQQARVIAYHAGEYILSRSVFDDCHGGIHMQAVLRRGQLIRDRMHEALLGQYQGKASVTRTIEA
jgi:hypothetical protein